MYFIIQYATDELVAAVDYNYSARMVWTVAVMPVIAA